MRVEQLEPAREDEWDEFLLTQDDSLVYYGLRYRDLLIALLGCQPEYLVARADDGAINGVLPLMWSDGVCNSLPYYGSNGGVLAAEPAAEQALLDAYNQRATDSATASATFVSNPLRPIDGAAHNLTDVRISQITELPEPDVVLEAIDSSARRNVRKAERAGFEIVRDPEGFGDLRRIHEENMHAIGGLAKDPEFFEAVPRIFRHGEDFELYIARRDGQTAAALLVFWWQQTTEYFTPVVAEPFRSEQPLALILAHAMRDASERGMRNWNWGGTWESQTGVYRFKRKWGARERRYTYWVQLNDESLREREPADLLAAWPGFFVVPFSELKRKEQV